ncbi:putative transcriptional regulator YvhJ [Actinomadura rubteroloni]|uniref:Putative transcriptional regulator YvhJ n=1 Tax=Actinomadura rubteroloni TaxID=1926885 RepID=A0A2P4UPL0_9ACTN|nr:LCP family protein [Actinomadura rubteroloni]POM26949.1 putative transcriptional regulator YvhJ [Actinomadura rubteroloni]
MNSNPMYMEYVDDADPQPARRRGWRILGWVSIGLSAVTVIGALTGYGLYRNALGNIAREDINASVGPNRPKKLNNAMNILVLGSDTRAGANAKYGRGMKNEPPRSDTMILMHLSPGGKSAIGISFPRDLLVPIPACRTHSGGMSAPASRAMINSSFTTGGAACTIKTIESLTDIKIDHFVQLDFTAVKNVTKAVGGVEVCLTQDVNDRDSKLHLTRGKHVISGDTALAYVRNRHGLGDGSDTQRIKRQQKFIGSLANKILSAGTLSNPSKLIKLLNATTKSLVVDKELNDGEMMQLAQSMSGLSSGKLRFVTVPSGPDAADPNRVALSSTAGTFFTAIRNDKAVPAPAKTTAAKIPPSQVSVRVYNGSGIAGQANRVATDLKAKGFQVTVGGNASSTAKTKVLYGSGADQQAATLAGQIQNAPGPKAYASAAAGVVNLVVGRDWDGVKGAQAGIPKQQGEIKASDNICKGA